ncbi:hypothetical protein [Sphingomonas sp. Leaf37]|uniref:hypothetical protein n=1 Tax=Sphingomonas sp. Leaf37 TaxID=2876552 RepID=UPI001E60658D|nr:hypothetical protein [Sphingomonas sp. Leaf37]
MAIRIPVDLGRPRKRPFQPLTTASGKFFGVKAPLHRSDWTDQIWMMADGFAHVLGVENPKAYPQTWTAVTAGVDPAKAIVDHLENIRGEGWMIQPLNIPPGRYFPRIARPYLRSDEGFPAPFYGGTEFPHERASASIQIGSLADRLRMCFQVVGPSAPNFNVFGSEFRNILLLACTEVEAQWKGILRANSYLPHKDQKRWTTADYVKLEPALRLGDYAVEFPEYPWLSPIAPFRGWDASNPSASLPWYAAYNLVKHDRELNGESATLIRSLEAVAAAVVVGVAQFGISFVRSAPRWRDLFQIHEHPEWPIGDTHGPYFGPEVADCGESLPYPFS